jgi:hypothetical protein
MEPREAPSVTDAWTHRRCSAALAVACLSALGAGCGGGDAATVPPPTEEPLAAWAPAPVLAQRLARLVWDAEPDAGLAAELAATPADAVAVRDAVGRAAERMLADGRARAGVGAFYRWWLLLDELPRLPKPNLEGVLDDALLASMTREAPSLGASLTLDTDGTFDHLLTAPYTFVDGNLARHYGLPGDGASTEMRRADYPAGGDRLGVLSGAGVLTMFASLANPSWPAKRSWLVVERALCVGIPSTIIEEAPPDPAKSIRQQMLDVTSDSTCMACHTLLNSSGFAFIGFDSFGRWRPEPGAAPNETTGWIPAQAMKDEPAFDGPAGLARLLAGRDETRRCFVRQWLQFALDRTQRLARQDDLHARTVDVAQARFASSGYRLRALIVAVARSNPFLAP